MPERKNKTDLSQSLALPSAAQPAPDGEPAAQPEGASRGQSANTNDIQPGSHDSVLLKKQRQAEKARCANGSWKAKIRLWNGWSGPECGPRPSPNPSCRQPRA